MATSQTQVNLERLVQLQLLWAKLDYLHLRNKHNCLTLHTAFKPNVNVTESTRASLMVDHTINRPDESQGLLKWLRAVFILHISFITLATKHTASRLTEPRRTMAVSSGWFFRKTNSWRIRKVHSEESVGGSWAALPFDLLAQGEHHGCIR